MHFKDLSAWQLQMHSLVTMDASALLRQEWWKSQQSLRHPSAFRIHEDV